MIDHSWFALRFFVYQTEKITAGHAGVAHRPREGAVPLQRGLPSAGAAQQPGQEFVCGASRQQELLWQLRSRRGGNEQSSVQVMGSPDRLSDVWGWQLLLIAVFLYSQRQNADLQWTQRVEGNGNYLCQRSLLLSHFLGIKWSCSK